MNKLEMDLLSKTYSPYITKILSDNSKYFQFNETVRWAFNFGQESAVVGAVGKDNVLKVNIYSVIGFVANNDLISLEYFLLHEIRHIYQNLIIEEYNNKNEIPIDEKLVKKWIFENDNYIKAMDENGNENIGYFLQDIEMDAYAFAFALMKFKYGSRTNGLYVPPVYGEEFKSIVKEWVDEFATYN